MKLLGSFKHAIRGLVYIFKHERNFRIHVAATMAVFFLAWFFGISRLEWAVIIVLVSLVLILESINTAFEKYLDVLKPRMNESVGVIKDILAGAVCILSLASILVGSLIFLPIITPNLL